MQADRFDLMGSYDHSRIFKDISIDIYAHSIDIHPNTILRL